MTSETKERGLETMAGKGSAVNDKGLKLDTEEQLAYAARRLP